MTQDTLAGTRLGHYRLVRRLGGGGMGRVYLAVSPSGRAVAMKILLTELHELPGFSRRFRNEIEAARKVSGAYTAAIVDADPDGTPPWLATEYIAGPSLQDAIEEFGPMAGQDLVRLAAGVAEALAAIHNAGLVHRDLTPANVLLSDNGPRVIDFGISRLIDEQGEAQPSSRILGVPGYMSPERIRGEPTTAAGDVFSLGAVVTFAAQGRSPFGEDLDTVLLDRTLNDLPQLDGVPPQMRGLIAACLDKDPLGRPASAHLARLFGGRSATAWADPLARRIRRDEHDLTATVRDRRLTRRVALIGGAALVTAAVSSVIALADKTAHSSAQRSGKLALAWSSALTRTDMAAATFGTTTVVCTDRLGTSSFDRASGAALWSDAGPRGEADSSDGQRVYSVRSDGRMRALDARTGRQLWVSDSADNPVFQLATPATIVVTAGGHLQGIDAGSGATRWTYSLSREYLGTMGTGAQHLIIYGVTTTSFNGAYAFTVLDLNSGQVRWERDLMDLYAPPTGAVFYALDTDMSLLAFPAASGKPLWSKQTALPSETTASLHYDKSLQLSEGTLFCYPNTAGNASGTGILTAFDPADGRTLWSINPASDAGGYAAANQVVCYLDGSMKAVNGRTGQAMWSAGGDLGLTQLAGAVNGLFLAVAPGNAGLYGWDARTGQQAWHSPVADGSGNWSFLHPPGGLLASRAGRLYSFQSLNEAIGPFSQAHSNPRSLSPGDDERQVRLRTDVAEVARSNADLRVMNDDHGPCAVRRITNGCCLLRIHIA
jgi:serine/threonine protein kinase